MNGNSNRNSDRDNRDPRTMPGFVTAWEREANKQQRRQPQGDPITLPKRVLAEVQVTEAMRQETAARDE